MKISNPHDKFFQESFQHKSVVIAYVKHFMPKSVYTQLDYDSFELDNQSYINENLKDTFSDLVYACTTVKNEKTPTSKLRIALLFEHKSYVPQYPLLQVFEYMLSIWKADQKQKKELTLIIPIVIYHGEQEWKHRQFSDMFTAIPNFIQPYFPNFKVHLTNITQTNDETIKTIGANFLTNTFLALKYSREAAYVLNNFKELFIFREQFLNSTLGHKQFIALFIYLSVVTKIDNMEELLLDLPIELQEKGLSAYEKAQLEGEKRVYILWEKDRIQMKSEMANEIKKAQLEAEKKVKKAQLEAEKKAKKAQIEAEKKAKKAQLEAEKKAKKAQLEAEKKTIGIILNLLQKNVFSIEYIANMMNVSVEYVLKIKKGKI